MFIERVKMYAYRLPCGRMFRTHVESVDPDEWHWFPCDPCGISHALRTRDLVCSAPPARHNHLDEAIIKDRIAKDLRSAYCSVSQQAIADRHGVSLRLVNQVAMALGINCSPLREAA